MKTVIFDLDGTLADTSGDLLAAGNATFVALGLAPPLGAGDEGIAHRGGRAMLRAGFARLGLEVDGARINQLYPELLRHYEGALAVHTQMYDGAEAAVTALLQSGFAAAICTNKPTYLAEALVSALGVRDLFGALIGAGSVASVKPDPAPYFAALAAVGGTASMLIGDTDTDRTTALNAGVPCALVTFGPNGGAVAALAPEALLHHFGELPELAVRLLGRP